MAADDLLLTRTEVAEWLHVAVQTVRRLAESGHLAEVQASASAVRVHAASVNRLEHKRCRVSGKPPGRMCAPVRSYSLRFAPPVSGCHAVTGQLNR